MDFFSWYDVHSFEMRISWSWFIILIVKKATDIKFLFLSKDYHELREFLVRDMTYYRLM